MVTLPENGTFESRELFRMAEASIQRGNYQRASVLLGEALKISPENSIFLSHLGFCIGMQGNVLAAEKICRRALKLSPLEPIVLVNLGRIFIEQGRRREARQLFMRAYKIDNTNAPAALELSRMGVRKRPVLPFLYRSHPVNIHLGKLRCKLIEYRNTVLKKL